MHARCLVPDSNISALLCVFLSQTQFLLIEICHHKKMPRAAEPTPSSYQRKSCCDKLCRWLNTAIRQHTVCLTKCFLPDTLELSWLLAAWFHVFIWAPLGGSVSISGGFGFLSPLRPRCRGHMARGCWRARYSWITYSPLWSHAGSQWWSAPLFSIYQTEAILCHFLTYLLTCFIWEQMLM